MNVKIFLLSALTLLFVSGCSGTYHAYYQTLKIAFSEQEDVEMTLIDVQQSRIDVISVKRGNRPNAIMALAYIENGQNKWISSDNAMLILEKGRIIRTLGLNENLLYTSNTDLDPLKSLPYLPMTKSEPKNQTWSRIIDRSDDEYGYLLESNFSLGQVDNLQALNLNISTTLYFEIVSFQAPANYLQLNNSWKNQYWYAKNGELIKSIQQVSPLSESLEITYLSRIARLNQ